MKKKNLLTLAIGCMLSLAACGPAEHVVDQNLPEDDPASEVEIVFWHCMGHAKGTVFSDTVVANFNAQYAGKYRVKEVHLAGDYTGLHSAAKTKMSSGEIPALAMGYPDSFSEYMTDDIRFSQILRLDNFLNDPNYGYSATELADFVPGYYNEGNRYQHTGTWSLPMYKSTEVMYYNASYFAGANDQTLAKFENEANPEHAFYTAFKALYDAANSADATKEQLKALSDYLTDAGNEGHKGYVYTVPTKWNEMFTLGAQMKADRTAQGLDDDFYPVGYDSDANMMISQMKQRGIEYTTRDAEGADHFVFYKGENKTKTEALIDEITGYIRSKVLVTKNSLPNNAYTNTYFTACKTAMSIGSTGGSNYNVSANFKVDIAPVPYYGDTPYYIQQGPSICFFDNNNPYIHKGAWLFYKVLADAEINCSLSLENSYDPIRISSYETDEYKEWISYAGEGLKYDVPGLTKDLTSYYMVSDVFVGSSTARTQIGKTIDYAMNQGYSTGEAALYEAYKECLGALA